MQIDLTDIGLNADIIAQLQAGNATPWEVKTPFTDWRNAANELARESEEEVAERAIELYNEVDPGRGRAIGGSTADLAYKEIVQEPNAAAWMDVYNSKGLSPYKVDPVSGEKVYINTPAGVNLIDLLQGQDKQEYLAKKAAGFDERLTNTPYNATTGLYGSGAGNYGTRVIPETPSNLQKALSSPAASILSSFIPGGPALLTGAKVLAGTDVGLMEAAGAVAGATKLAGTPTATALADNIEFTAAVASGNPALAVLNKGTDLVNEKGEVVGRTTLGKKYTTDALEKAGLTDKILSKEYNINQDDLVEGLVRTEKELVKGSSLDDALLKGLGTYVKEGGSLSGLPNLPDLPNLNLAFKTPELIKEAEDVVRAVGSATEDVARVVGSAIDQPVQAIKEGAEAIYESLEAPQFSSVDVDFPSVDVDLPSVDVDFPSVDVDLPSVDVDLPSVGLPSPSIGLAISQPQSTKGVTESVFEDFLFEKKYQAPELIERIVPLAQYTAPQGMFRNIV